MLSAKHRVVHISEADEVSVKTYHPDRNPGREIEVVSKFHTVQVAYQILSNKWQRASYHLSRAMMGLGLDNLDPPARVASERRPYQNAETKAGPKDSLPHSGRVQGEKATTMFWNPPWIAAEKELDHGQPPTSPSSLKRNVPHHQLEDHFQHGIEELERIADEISINPDIDTIFEQSQFYVIVFALVAESVRLIDKWWPGADHISNPGLALATFNRIRDLHFQWAIWCEDAFQPETRVGSWEISNDFQRSTLCPVVQHRLASMGASLRTVLENLQPSFLQCLRSRCVSPFTCSSRPGFAYIQVRGFEAGLNADGLKW
jgi:DnaJ domain